MSACHRVLDMMWSVDRVLGARTVDADRRGEVALALGEEDPEAREALLEQAGYEVVGGYVVDGDGDPVRDPYFGTAVAAKEAVLLPRAGAVVEAHPLSVRSVLGEES